MTCQRTDTLAVVIDKIVKGGVCCLPDHLILCRCADMCSISFYLLQVHRLIITDSDGQLTGVISLSDILFYLVQDDSALNSSISNTSCSSMMGPGYPAKPVTKPPIGVK